MRDACLIVCACGREGDVQARVKPKSPQTMLRAFREYLKPALFFRGLRSSIGKRAHVVSEQEA